MDLQALLVNYVKCYSIARGGVGMGVDFLKADALTQKLFALIGKLNAQAVQEYFGERKAAEDMFDQAVKSLK